MGRIWAIYRCFFTPLPLDVRRGLRCEVKALKTTFFFIVVSNRPRALVTICYNALAARLICNARQLHLALSLLK